MEKQRPLIIAGVCLLTTSTAYGFGMFLLPMVLPEMTDGLGLDYACIGTVTGGSQIAALLSIPFADLLIRRFGALPIMIMVQLAGAFLLIGFYQLQGFFDFFCFAFLIRAWPVMIWIPQVAIASDHIPAKWRGTFFTVISAVSCATVSFDGIYSSWFLTHSHWRTMWLTASAISFAVGLIGLAALKYSGAWNWKKNNTVQKTTKTTADLITWLKSPGGIVLNLLFLITGLAFISFQIYLAPYLREELNTGLDTVTMMWSVMGLSSIPGGLIFGVLVRRIGIKNSFFLTFVLGITAVACLLTSHAPVPLMAAALSFGVAQAVIYGLGPAYISRVLSASAASRAFAVGMIIINAGGIAGNFLGGWSSEALGTFRWLYLTAGGLFTIGAMLSLILVSESTQKSIPAEGTQ